MANTYNQIYIHYVIVVKHREALIHKEWKDELYKYINGIIKEQGHKLMAINGMPDHVHLLVSMNPKQAPSDLMHHVKRCSSLWINRNKALPSKFSWQSGFGSFSYAKSQVHSVANYIERQEKRHAKQSFRNEYVEFLEKFEIDFDESYIFKDVV